MTENMPLTLYNNNICYYYIIGASATNEVKEKKC